MREPRSLKHGTQSRDGHAQSAPSPQQRSEPGLIPRPRGSRRAARDAAGSAPWGRDPSRGATRRVPNTAPCMRDSGARCPGVRGTSVCRSHGVGGCLSSPAGNAGGGELPGRFQDVLCPCEGQCPLQSPTPEVRCHGSKARGQGPGAEAERLWTRAKARYARFELILHDSQKEKVHRNFFFF